MNIRITGLPVNHKINAIKTVRFAFGLGLKDSKDLVESTPANEDGTLTIEGEMNNAETIESITRYVNGMTLFGTNEPAMPNVKIEKCKAPRLKISDLKAKIEKLEQEKNEAKQQISTLQIHNSVLLNEANDKIRYLHGQIADKDDRIESILTQRDEAIDDFNKLAARQTVSTTLTIGNQAITIINAESIHITPNEGNKN